MSTELRRGAGMPSMVAILAAVVGYILLSTEGAGSVDVSVGRGGDGGIMTRSSNVMPEKPHIVFMLIDDLGFNDVPWNNDRVNATVMRDLATNGLILNRSYTQATCTPSRAALLTGRYPFSLDSVNRALSEATPKGLGLNYTLLPEKLKSQNYTTHMVGKWHLGFCNWDYTPTYRGFDSFYGFYTTGEDYNTHDNRWMLDEPRHKYLDLRNNTEPVFTQDGVYSTDMYASYVENLLAGRDPQVPMFLYLAFQSVHTPRQVPSEYSAQYTDIQNTAREEHLGMVSALDKAVGRVVQALKDTSHYNNTIIIFTTDNGGNTNEGSNNYPLRGEKATLYEGGTRGAGFVHAPFLTNHGVSNELIHITDWYPTLVKMAGGDPAIPGIDGKDQLDTIMGLAPSTRSEMVYSIDERNGLRAAIRNGSYKLLVGRPGSGQWTLPPEGTTRKRQVGNAGSTRQDVTVEDDEREAGVVATARRLAPFKASALGSEIATLAQNVFGSDTVAIRLYNLDTDPTEEDNVANQHKPEVADMLRGLQNHMNNYIAPDPTVADDLGAHPQNFNDVWSPGWC